MSELKPTPSEVACPPQYLHSPFGGRQDRIDQSIAKQLQNSMELNARMKNRLLKLAMAADICLGATQAIEQIMKDEEPTWPAA